ncbi:amidohydrolase family protein [Pseudomonas izuensis]|uniref:Amidohydrolase family protein n=1 Tax=Pseudomonas izuensis TaxID=2684212 RepID=A0ABM7RTF9_9PSED|nr:amidohydrolase family protein [Pseudomonas izuensis]BCX69014.1 amidohydrolase family protein [Pseudomonas izuensis]
MATRLDDSGFSRRSLLQKTSVVLTAGTALGMPILSQAASRNNKQSADKESTDQSSGTAMDSQLLNLLSQPKIDCHHHVIDPAQFPYPADATYQPAGPEIGPAAYYEQVMQAYGIRHSVIVQPTSAYGYDNRCLLDTLARHKGRHKGVVVVPNDVTSETLAQYKAQGVVGVALNAALLGPERFLNIDTLMGRLAELELYAQVQVKDDQLLALLPLLERTRPRVLIDHSGRPDVGAGLQQPAFQALLSLASNGRTFVKLSGLSQYSRQSFPYADAQPYQRALLQAFTAENCMWGTDWPFLRARQSMALGTVLTNFGEMFPNASDRQQILWETPKRLFGFTA